MQYILKILGRIYQLFYQVFLVLLCQLLSGNIQIDIDLYMTGRDAHSTRVHMLTVGGNINSV